MEELQDLARQLLSQGIVNVVIGYEEGPRGARPTFITEVEQCGKLIFDHRCAHNLTAYLNPRRKHITKLGKPAIVVKGCDARSLAGLIREKQVERSGVTIIAVRCSGVLKNPEGDPALTSETVSVRCARCELQEPNLRDYLVGERPSEPPVNARRTTQIAQLMSMSVAERREFWNGQFLRCIRCHACREACPMCFCIQCTAEKSQPQWIDPSATPRGNRAWHTMRAMHHAGRCADCLECERACPEDIPLGLLTRFVANVVERRFDYTVRDDPSIRTPLGVFSTEDEEEFIG